MDIAYYKGTHFTFRKETDPMTDLTEIAIISLASGIAIGYAIGIIQHLADHNWRFDSMEWI